VPPAPALTASVLPNDVVPAAPVAAIAPVAETVASELPAAAEVRREASAAPVAPVPSPGEERVRQTVLSYRDAYESLNADAAAAVWPSVDRRALTRAFATLKSQGLEFRQCAITMNDTRATVSCRGTLRVVPKVGSSAPLAAEQQWIFRMRRSGADWTIDDVSSAQVAATARAGGQD
jgi:intracellular sulfur oxidation DsrE/DsrF family protein